MGSFNVGCGISSLSINYGDKVGFVILDAVPADLQGFPLPGESTGALHMYTTDLSRPILPPLYGRYDDYGQIKDVEDTITARLVASMFHRPVETVINAIARSHRIYDNSEPTAQAYLKPGHLLGKSYSTPAGEILQSLGFTREKDKDGDEVYAFQKTTLVKRHGSEDTWAIFTPRRKNAVGEIQERYISHVLDLFAKHTKLYPGFEPEDWDAIQRIHDLHGMFFLKDVYRDLNKAVKHDGGWDFQKNRRKGLKADWHKFLAKFDETDGIHTPETPYASSWFTPFNEFITREMQMRPEDYDLLKVYQGSNEFLQVYDLLRMMTAVNRMLGPTLNGDQNGNTEASLALAKIEQRILKARINEYE